MKLTGISSQPQFNRRALKIGRYTFVFSRYFGWQTSRSVDIRSYGKWWISFWVIKELDD